MACSSCGGNSGKMSNHSSKKMPNWGMTSKPMGGAKKMSGGSGGFGTPKVKMSFSGKNKNY